jgi:hypothetical protein
MTKLGSVNKKVFSTILFMACCHKHGNFFEHMLLPHHRKFSGTCFGTCIKQLGRNGIVL